MTLLTLDYGEIVRVGSIARVCAVVEAFLGQVYLVVLVARLVALQAGQGMLDAEARDYSGQAKGSTSSSLNWAK